MQDRYLFRGKRIDNGKWVHWNRFGQCTEAVWTDDGMYSHIAEQYVDPATVGQCTGLKDKNGKLIFEGDILSGGNTYGKEYGEPVVTYGYFIDGAIAALKYNSEPEANEDHDAITDLSTSWYGWHFRFEDTGEAGIDPEYIDRFEVIGNIHDKVVSSYL